jgi:hypothetical protein
MLIKAKAFEGQKRTSDLLRDGLNLRQWLFVEHYTGDFRGKASPSARAAGYNGTPASVRVMASALLRHPKVRAAIERRLPDLLAPLVDAPPKLTPDVVLLVRAVGHNRYKLGFAKVSPADTLRLWQTQSPVPLALVATWAASRGLMCLLSKRFAGRRAGASWFTLDEASARLLVETAEAETKNYPAADGAV